MVERAKMRHPSVKFKRGTIQDEFFSSHKYDYLVASGIFAHRQQKPEVYLEKTITKMFLCARKRIAFSSLSSWIKVKEKNEFYADPSRVMGFCGSITPHVVLRHDYHPVDFTIYMYKNRNS